MNIEHTLELLEDFPAEYTPKLIGQHGIGKTEIIRQLCDRPVEEGGWGLRCCELQGGQLSDVGDLIGLMKIVTIVGEDGKEYQESIWIPPYWFPKDGKPFCLFLDEINRAAPPIKRAMMQLANDRRILNFELPKGSRVVCAVNPNRDADYDVEDFDDAEEDRYWNVFLQPDVSEFLSYAAKAGILPVIINYISKFDGDLDCYSLEKETKVTKAKKGGKDHPAKPSRRSWFRLDKCMKVKLAKNPRCFSGTEGKARLENLATGWLGPHVASSFADFFEQHGMGLDPERILTGDPDRFDTDVLPLLTDAINDMTVANRLGTSMVNYLHEKQNQMINPAGKGDNMYTEFGVTVSRNMFNFLSVVKEEVAACIANGAIRKARDSREIWALVLSSCYDPLKNLLIKLVSWNTVAMKTVNK